MNGREDQSSMRRNQSQDEDMNKGNEVDDKPATRRHETAAVPGVSGWRLAPASASSLSHRCIIPASSVLSTGSARGWISVSTRRRDRAWSKLCVGGDDEALVLFCVPVISMLYLGTCGS